MIERGSKDCLVPTQQFFRYIMARTSYFQWDDYEIRSNTDFFIVLAHYNKIPRIDMTPLWHIILIRANQSFSLILRAKQKQQILIL